MTKTTQTSMAMNNLDLLPYNNIAEYRKEGEHGWHCGFSIDDKEWDMIDFESICKVPNTSPACVGMGDDDHFVPTINQLR